MRLCREVDDQLRGGLLAVVRREEVEVVEFTQPRRPARVDPVRVDHDAGLLRLAEHLGQPHPRDGLGVEQVPQDLAGADARQLVDVADEQQVGARPTALASLLASSTSSIEASSTTTRSASSGSVLVVAASPPGLSSSKPVHGGGLGAGQLGQPLGRAAGGRGENDLRALGPRQFHDRADGEGLLPQPGPPVSTATLRVSASLTACCCSGASPCPVRCGASRALSQSTSPGTRRDGRAARAAAPASPAGQRPLRAVERDEVEQPRRVGPLGERSRAPRLSVSTSSARQVTQSCGDDRQDLAASARSFSFGR